MSIVLQGSTSGSITLQEPAVAGSTVLDLPATSGTVLTSASPASDLPSSIKGPAFSAYQGLGQTINAGVEAKVTFDTENFDTNNNFASSRFTPTVAGYYQVNACVSIALATGYIVIYKNGSANLRGFQTNSSVVGFVVSGLVYCNGSTDYLEIYLANQTAGNATTNAVSTLTWFNGSLVRAA